MHLRVRLLDGHHQTIFADGKSDAGRVDLRSQLLGEPVVTPAPEHRVLRTQGTVYELERGARVVIETADEAGLHRVDYSPIVEQLPDGCEMRQALPAKMVEDGGQRVDDGLIGRHLAVEHAQGIRHGAALAVMAHVLHDARELLAQCFEEQRPAFWTADGVKQDFIAYDAGLIQNLGHHFNNFGIDYR